MTTKKRTLSPELSRCNDRRCPRRFECLRHMADDPQGAMVWQADTFRDGDVCESFIPLPKDARWK